MSFNLRFSRYLPALFPMLAMLLGFTGAPTALAQAPPTSVTSQAEGPTGILVSWVSCQTSGDANCQEYFTIYRNPPSLDTLLFVTNTANDSKRDHLDTDGLKASTTYSYLVCTGEKLADGSNCVSTSATTLPPQSSGGSGNGSGNGTGNQGSQNETNTSTPPTDLKALAGDSTVLLDWQNPQSNWPLVIEIYRVLTGGGSPGQIAVLNGDVSVKVPPNRWEDPGPLGPHYTYNYYVCSGSYDIQMRNCAYSNPVISWGANPIVSAVRSSTTTVKLSVAVDNLETLSWLKITRQDNSGPCGKGTTLGNGTQGCKTTTYGANGVPINAPVITTIYDKGRPSTTFGASTATAPYVIDIPDDTVTAGVEYYYQAAATWNGSLTQDSQTVTVPAGSLLHYLPQHTTFAKSVSGVHSAGMKAGTQQSGSAKVSPATVGLAQVKVKANPNDAQSLYTLGQSYCKANLKSACLSTMYLGLLQSQKAGTTALTNQIKTSMAAEGVTVNGVK
jgi:hypothetical protein